MPIIVNDTTKSERGRRFSDYLGKAPYARKALERLEWEGYPRRIWLPFLHEYITSSERLEPRRRAARLVADEARRCLRALSKSSARMSSLLDKTQFDISSTVLLQGIKRMIGEWLETISKMEKEQRKAGTARGAGRDEQLLVILSLGIQRHTGAKHHSELAYLLEAAAAAHGRRMPADQDQVRKVIARYKDGFPESYKSLEELFGPSKDQPKELAVKAKIKNLKKKHNPPRQPIQIEYPFHLPPNDEPGL